MASYTITVNDKSYDVTVEKKSGAATQAAAPAVSGAGAISAPMPGKIAFVRVNVGDNVKKGQELIILEAMKMQNPLLASSDGVVKEIYVKIGDPVKPGTPLILVG